MLTEDRQTSSLVCAVPLSLSLRVYIGFHCSSDRSQLLTRLAKKSLQTRGIFFVYITATFCCRNLRQIFPLNHILMGRLTINYINLTVILKMLLSLFPKVYFPQLSNYHSISSLVLAINLNLADGPPHHVSPVRFVFYQNFQERAASELHHTGPRTLLLQSLVTPQRIRSAEQ